MQFVSSMWHTRALFLTHIGIELNFARRHDTGRVITGGLSLKDTTAKGEPAATEDTVAPGGKVSMPADKAELQRVLDRCKNTMHVCTTIALDEKYSHMARMLLYASTCYVTWLADLRKSLTSREETLKHSIIMATGEKVCQAILELFSARRC